MDLLQALILGIVQGLTEFLPVSSSGHIELGKAIFGMGDEENLTFSIIVHFATVLSTIVVFRKDIVELLKGWLKFSYNDETKFLVLILLSMIPVGLIGVLFKDEVESLFANNTLLVGCMLCVTGTLLLVTHWAKDAQKEITPQRAFIVGIAQAVAVLPGISRSGSTIATGLLLGIDKAKIARFSFLMVIPPILGATLLEVKDLVEAPSTQTLQTGALAMGFSGAFFSGWAACKGMIEIVKRGKTREIL